LTNFLTEYLDGNLSEAEKASFEEYLTKNQTERKFARKAKKGKNILAQYRDKLEIPCVKTV
jgi:anti-sigma factor RsiW